MQGYIELPLFKTEEVFARVICAEDTRPGMMSDEERREMDREAFSRFALLPQQTHSLNVGIIESDRYGGYFPETDALVSFNPVVAVGVVTADCVPVVIYAPDVKGVAAVHAGWRGTLGGIVDKVVKVLKSRGASPGSMQVAFGPSISAAAYEVSPDLAERFVAEGFGTCVTYPDCEGGKPHIDLQGVNAMRLRKNGIKESNIRLSEIFTDSATDISGNRLFPSYRRDAGTAARLLTAISLF